jgi:hypothetical protein
MRPDKLPNDELVDLIERFRRVSRSYKRSGTIYSCLSTSCVTVVALLLLGLTTCGVPGVPTNLSGILLGLLFALFGACGLIGGSFVLTMHARRREDLIALRSLVSGLATSNDTRAISPLLAATTIRDRQTRQMAEDGLIRLMNMASPGSPNGLGASDLEALHYALYSEHAEYVLADLHLLKHVGNRSSLWFVKGLVRGNGPLASVFASSNDDWVVEAARDTAAYIKNRLKHQTAGDVLLRPTGEVQKDDALLRPVAGAGGDTSEQLLRPGLSEDE